MIDFDKIFRYGIFKLTSLISLHLTDDKPIAVLHSIILGEYITWDKFVTKKIEKRKFMCIFTVALGPRFNIMTILPGMKVPMLKITLSLDRLIFNMGIPIPTSLYWDGPLVPLVVQARSLTLNSLAPGNAICQHRIWSTLVQLVVYCLMAPEPLLSNHLFCHELVAFENCCKMSAILTRFMLIRSRYLS